MGKHQLMRRVTALDEVKQQSGESLLNFYGRVKNVNDIDCRVTNGEITQAFVRTRNPRIFI